MDAKKASQDIFVPRTRYQLWPYILYQVTEAFGAELLGQTEKLETIGLKTLKLPQITIDRKIDKIVLLEDVEQEPMSLPAEGGVVRFQEVDADEASQDISSHGPIQLVDHSQAQSFVMGWAAFWEQTENGFIGLQCTEVPQIALDRFVLQLLYTCQHKVTS